MSADSGKHGQCATAGRLLDHGQALDHSLKHWTAQARVSQDGRLPVDNNWIENEIRPIAIGQKNWLVADSLRAGKCAVAPMRLIQPAKLNGHDPHACLKNAMTRLLVHSANQISALLPHLWQAYLLLQA